MFARSFAFRAFSHQGPRVPSSQSFFASSPTWRYFTSSIPRTKAAVKAQPPRSPVKSTPPNAKSEPEVTLKFAGRRPEGFGRLERKVAKEGEIILFRAPSHRSYVLGAYGIAGFCFAYSVYNSNIVFRDPIMPLPMWQQALFGGICVMMSVMGTVFLFKTSRLINSVNAVKSNGRATLRFNVRSALPFRKPYEFDALPHQIAFSRRLVISPDALKHPHHADLAPKKTKSTVSFFRSPLKKSSMLVWKLFRSVRQIFTQEDFVLLEAENQKGIFRMDSAGYMSEDFLVIGNPLSLKR